jgi:Protein of unknown function (DUF1553)/Protein of unknown function (DUF1549)/Planctomycete cytochrome C
MPLNQKRYCLLERPFIATIVMLSWQGVYFVNAAFAVDFVKQVQPLLVEKCSKCHGETTQKGGFRTDTKEAFFAGGESGVAVAKDSPDASKLLERITSNDPDTRMPPGGNRLSSNEVSILRDWIRAGAVWPDDPIAHVAESHWAFQPIERDRSTSIDLLVDEIQGSMNLTHTSPADRATLLRRLTWSLTGLPPSLEAWESFSNDRSNTSVEEAVDRLLQSPQFGERFGRYWLDLARWAESDGYEANELRSHAWRYRDYIIQAFNDDLPYDRFLLEQIAGDELESRDDRYLIATGFLAATRTNNNEEDKQVQLNEPLVDIANTTASIALGMTLACAQCHDHKFEPLSIRDYYAWHGYFLRGQVNSLPLALEDENAQWVKSKPPELNEARMKRAQLLATLEDREGESQKDGDKKESAKEARDRLAPAERELYDELTKKIKDLEKDYLDKRPQTWGFYSPATSPHQIDVIQPRGQYPFVYDKPALIEKQPRVLRRGDVHQQENVLTPDVPQVLTIRDAAHRAPRNRRELVEWLTSDKNPLTARVWVNHIWQFHFGRGIVESAGDFGVRGNSPTNRALLDYLASELIASGWSTKHVHRLIVLSRTFQRSSAASIDLIQLDPQNRFLTRWLPKRLEGEAIRDGMLAVSGLLDFALGGPSQSIEEKPRRRSIYLTQKRYLIPNALALFDAPTANEFCPKRHTSTVPLQPLNLLNNPENMVYAQAFVDRVVNDYGPNWLDQFRGAMRLALLRLPTENEVAATAKWRDAQLKGGLDEKQISLLLCQGILNLNEFVYVP